MDSVKDSANKKSSTAGLSPIEEVDLVDHFHSNETINKHHDLKTQNKHHDLKTQNKHHDLKRQNKHHDLKRQTQGRKMETSSLLVEADVSLDTTGV